MLARTGAALLLAFAAPAQADFIWAGGGINGNWSLTANWQDVDNDNVGDPPPANDDTTGVTFTGANRVQTQQNIGNPLTLNRITFDANAGAAQAGFSIRGNKIVFNGDRPALVVDSNNAAITHTFFAPVDLPKELTVKGSGSSRLSLRAVSGVGALTKAADSSFTLLFEGNTSNSYTGATSILGGALQLDKGNGAIGVAGALVVGDGNGSAEVQVLGSEQIKNDSAVTLNKGGRLRLTLPPNLNGSKIETIGTLQGAGEVVLEADAQRSTTLKTGGAGAATPFSGVISGAGHLVKAGNNTLLLSGNNTYTGTTTVTQGILDVSGQIGAATARSGLVTVKGGGRLQGTGKVFTVGAKGVTIEANGTIKGGRSPGVLSLDGGLDLQSGALLLADLDGASPLQVSRLDVTGEVAVGGSSFVGQLHYVPTSQDKLFVVANDLGDAVSGQFAQGSQVDLVSSANQGIYRFQISYEADFASGSLNAGNDIALHDALFIGTVPEPPAWLLALLGAAALRRACRSLLRSPAPACA